MLSGELGTGKGGKGTRPASRKKGMLSMLLIYLYKAKRGRGPGRLLEGKASSKIVTPQVVPAQEARVCC